MSADNTIGILATKRRDGKEGLEYRVAHVQAIENLWDAEQDYPPHKPVLSREYLRMLFGDARVIRDPAEAADVAERMEEEAEYVEYGIRQLNYPDIFFPASDGKRRRRARYLAYRARQRQTV